MMTEMQKCSVRDLQDRLTGRTVMLRTDFNVLLELGDTVTNLRQPFMVQIANDSCIKNSVETVRFLHEEGAKIVVCSHLTNPYSQRDPLPSMECIALKLEHELQDTKADLKYAHDCIGNEVKAEIRAMRDGDVMVLENVSLYDNSGIRSCDEAFCKKLANDAEFFVLDDFGNCHLDLASTVGIGQQIPVHCMGLQMKAELEFLSTTFECPARPVAVVIGGDQVAARLNTILKLVGMPGKVDKILIGGAVVFPFYCAMGATVGDAAVTAEQVQLAHIIKQEADRNGVTMVLASDSRIVPTSLLQKHRLPPVDAEADADSDEGNTANLPAFTPLNLDFSTHKAVQLGVKRVPQSMSPGPPGPLFEPAARGKVAQNDGIPGGFAPVDIADGSVQRFCDELAPCKTVLWCGPMGVFENREFAHGTVSLMQYMSHLTEHGATTIVCGGDTVAAVHHELYKIRHAALEVAAAAQSEKEVGMQVKEPAEALEYAYTSRGSAALSYFAGERLHGLDVLDDLE